MNTNTQTADRTILQNLNNDKELQKGMRKLSHYSEDQFIHDAERYISAIKEGRMICSIISVSNSGMSRNIKFLSCHERNGTKPGELGRYCYLNYFAFFKALGYTESRTKDGFRIGGAGMDMVFHTNYTNIHRLKRWGFINEVECAELAQQTPTVI